MAPEVSDFKGSYNGYKVDVYSLGVCLFGMIAGQLPFKENNEESTSSSDKEMKLNRTLLNMPSEQWDSLSYHLKDLLKGMLEKDPMKRISMSDVVNHPWINEYDQDWAPDCVYSSIKNYQIQEMEF